MEKQIKAYIQEAKLRLEALSPPESLSPETRREELRDFVLYHERRLRDFQHERLVHLLITLFFGSLLILFFLLSLLICEGVLFPSFGLPQSICVFVLTLVLLVTEGFYVRHYFFLENSVQLLYEIHKKLYELLGISA